MSMREDNMIQEIRDFVSALDEDIQFFRDSGLFDEGQMKMMEFCSRMAHRRFFDYIKNENGTDKLTTKDMEFMSEIINLNERIGKE